MTWSVFWTEYLHFIGTVGNIFSAIPPIITTMICGPLLFALMYGFVKLVRGLRN